MAIMGRERPAVDEGHLTAIKALPPVRDCVFSTLVHSGGDNTLVCISATAQDIGMITPYT